MAKFAVRYGSSRMLRSAVYVLRPKKGSLQNTNMVGKEKIGMVGGISPLMTLMMMIMIVTTNWHEHSMLTLLA